jgi:hypothetical protein
MGAVAYVMRKPLRLPNVRAGEPGGLWRATRMRCLAEARRAPVARGCSGRRRKRSRWRACWHRPRTRRTQRPGSIASVRPRRAPSSSTWRSASHWCSLFSIIDPALKIAHIGQGFAIRRDGYLRHRPGARRRGCPRHGCPALVRGPIVTGGGSVTVRREAQCRVLPTAVRGPRRRPSRGDRPRRPRHD